MSQAHVILKGYRLQQGLSPEEFAKQLGVALPTLRSLENGWRPITPERAKQIEECTNGALKRSRLRPDIFEAAA